MGNSSTDVIVLALTKAIVEHRINPGTKLPEEKMAIHFGVSRTLVRQAFFHLSQKHLIYMEPARGAFVATPSVSEAKEVFAVRRLLEGQMIRDFIKEVTPAQLTTLKKHVAKEQAAINEEDVNGRTELLGDFHVRIAQLMRNEVLAQILMDLISRCALITLMYQSNSAAVHSHREHVEILKAITSKNEGAATKLMDQHLLNVEASLVFDRQIPNSDLNVVLG